MVSGKKVAWIGCLGCGGLIFLILMVLAAGIGFVSYQGYQFGKGVGEAYKAVFIEYNELNQKYPFEPPEDGVLNEERTALVMQVRQSTAEIAKEKQESIGATGDEVGEKMESPGIRSKIEGIKKIAAIVQKAAHIGADIAHENIRLLDEQKMSVNEYRWVVKTFLGTLNKASDRELDDTKTVWNEYLLQFDKSADQMGDMNIDMGKDRFRSRDINRHELLDRIEDVPFIEQNYAIVQTHIEELNQREDAGIIDFFAVKMNEMIKDATSTVNETSTVKE